jgi:two-component system NtrC family sensor kinase
VVTLAGSRLFSEIPPDELDELCRVANLRRFSRGDVVFKEGDPGDGLYVVVEGEVELSAKLEIGTQRVLCRMGPGDFFGELAVLDERKRSAQATAAEDCSAYFLHREDLLKVVARSPRLAMNLLREICAHLRHLNQLHLHEIVQAERLSIVGRFAQSIVHDLKNPLTVIGLSADSAMRDPALPDGVRRKIQMVRKQVDRIDDLVGDVLEFTRGTVSNIPPRKVAYGGLVRHVLEGMREEIEQKGKALEVGEVPESIEVVCDSKRISRVLVNLVNNAVESLPQDGKVSVSVAAHGKDIVTEVADTGGGISPKVVARLFEPFVTHGKVHGTGLGLSICRRIVQDHGGWIRGTNRPGGGAVFSFGLPRASETVAS